MTDLLSQRLKNAKRELLALKTAHGRGLGNLRVYSYAGAIPSEGYRDKVYKLIATVEFDPKFSAYPFTYLLPTLPDSGRRVNIDIDGVEYINNGHGAKYQIFYNFQSAPLDNYIIISTAPINSVSYTWSEY